MIVYKAVVSPTSAHEVSLVVDEEGEHIEVSLGDSLTFDVTSEHDPEWPDVLARADVELARLGYRRAAGMTWHWEAAAGGLPSCEFVTYVEVL